MHGVGGKIKPGADLWGPYCSVIVANDCLSLLQQVLLRMWKRIEALQRRYPHHLSAAIEPGADRVNGMGVSMHTR